MYTLCWLLTITCRETKKKIIRKGSARNNTQPSCNQIPKAEFLSRFVVIRLVKCAIKTVCTTKSYHCIFYSDCWCGSRKVYRWIPDTISECLAFDFSQRPEQYCDLNDGEVIFGVWNCVIIRNLVPSYSFVVDTVDILSFFLIKIRGTNSSAVNE